MNNPKTITVQAIKQRFVEIGRKWAWYGLADLNLPGAYLEV
jgi:hypothetical protein